MEEQIFVAHHMCAHVRVRTQDMYTSGETDFSRLNATTLQEGDNI